MAAATSISSNSYTRITSTITGLTYPDGDYDWFHFNLYRYNTGTTNWDYVATSGNINTNSKTFITSPGYNYKVYGSVSYDSTTYNIGYSSESALSVIPTPTISGESVTNQTIIFTTALTFGARATQWWGSTNNVNYQWYDISVIKATYKYDAGHNYFYFNYSISGNQITFTGLADNQVQYYSVRATYDGYYSAVAENSAGQGYLDYTTYYNAPTLTSNVITAETLISFRSAANGAAGSYQAVDWEWGVYGVNYANSHSQSTTAYTVPSLSPGTHYQVRVKLRNTTSGYSSDWKYAYPYTESLTTPGSPSNVSVTINTGYYMYIYYSWGSNATSMDFRWGEDGSTWITTYSSQTANNYSSYNYSVNTVDAGTKYFQVRSRRLESGYTTYSSWVNASPWPFTITDRPSNWAWTSTVTSGGAISINNSTKKITILTATEWNAFCVRINEFRVYKSYGNYSFTTVVSGNSAYASQANQARTAISTLSPSTALPSAVVQFGNVTASFINGLKNSLNSI